MRDLVRVPGSMEMPGIVRDLGFIGLPYLFIILVTSDQALKDLHGTVEPDFASEASVNRLTPSCIGTPKYET